MSPLGKNIAPKKVHTRRFPDPNPPKVVENLERILRRSNVKADKGIPHLQKSLSLLAKSVNIVESIILDKETDQSLLRSKSSSELSQVITGPKRLNLSRPAQQPSQPSSTSLFPQNQNTQSVHIPVTYSPTFVLPTVPMHTVVLPNPLIGMVARITPLVFPTQLHDLPQGYSQRIKTDGAEGDISTQQHLDRFNDFCDLD